MIKISRWFLLFFLFLFVFLSFNLAFAKKNENKLFLEYRPFLINYAYNNNLISPTLALEKQNPGKAFIKSLILPGWGEISVGRSTRSKSFIIAEGLLWSSFATLKIYSHWKQNDFEDYAIERAGVNSTGKAKSYYSDIGNFNNIFEYNEEKRRFRQYDEVYPVDADHFWEWKNEADLSRFDELRSSSELASRNATLVVGGILVNHILSAIDAVWVTHQSNKTLSSNIRINPTRDQFGELYLNFTLSTSW